MILDRHTLALISICGSSLDMFGALYLAYDLLGGEHGPLRTLTRAITYGALFGIGYGIPMGALFGLATGLAHGITLAWEYSRASRRSPMQGFWHDVAVSAIRGVGFIFGAAYVFGWTFSITFGVLSTLGQVVAYTAGIRPTMDYQPAARIRLTKQQLRAVLIRSVGYGSAAYISAMVAQEQANAVRVGVKMGLVIGAVTALASACMPFIEWIADHVPQMVGDRHTGWAFSIGYIRALYDMARR